MLNVIKMDLHRLVKSKSLYVILAIVVAIVCLSLYIANMGTDNIAENPERSNQLQAENVANEGTPNVGISFYVDAEKQEDVTLLAITQTFYGGGFLLLFTGIFVVLYICDETKTGFIKNIGGYVKKRWYLSVSKLVPISVFVFLAMFTSLLFTCISGNLFLEKFAIGNLNSLVHYIALQYLLHVAFGILIMFISIVLKSKAISMVVSICLCSGFGTLFISNIDKIIQNGNGTEQFLTKYVITSNVQLLTSSINHELSMRIILVSITAIIVYNVFSGIIMTKRDIN